MIKTDPKKRSASIASDAEKEAIDGAIRRWHPVRPSAIYPSFWKFAAERQGVFFNRYYGLPAPWSDDEILQTYKFTNVYRLTDRVSQFLIRHIIYSGDQSPPELFFRIMLFKIFNSIATWEALEREFKSLEVASFQVDKFDDYLSKARESGQTIFSAAYIMPSGSGGYQCPRKHRSYLELLDTMLRDRLYDKIADSASMRAGFDLIRAYPMMGDFLSYQYLTDLNYSPLIDHSESQFVVPGPGALRGIAKCFDDLSGLSETDIIQLVTQRQEIELDALNVQLKWLFGRKLQYIDVQNLFCEFDKYSRVAFPELSAASGRTRIKQRFRPEKHSIDYFFPPKWHIKPDDRGEESAEQLAFW